MNSGRQIRRDLMYFMVHKKPHLNKIHRLKRHHTQQNQQKKAKYKIDTPKNFKINFIQKYQRQEDEQMCP